MLLEMLFIAAVIDGFQGLFLTDEVAVHHITDFPFVFAILAIPLTLTSSSLLERTGFTDAAFDNFPSHAMQPSKTSKTANAAQRPASPASRSPTLRLVQPIAACRGAS